ncbi:MAG: MmcQ/YjbR family DNA-binding protein [Acidobacteria bacterium]|nr:MmcQ/YjbR family DNA-binding protein [Acidobacteriota bacterium]
MTVEQVRALCLAFPHVTEDVKWEHDLVFSIGGKMFAINNLEPGGMWLSFKCSPEDFAELSERPGCRPAPYLARAQWISLETPQALPRPTIERLLRQAYDLVFAKLTKKARRELEG